MPYLACVRVTTSRPPMKAGYVRPTSKNRELLLALGNFLYLSTVVGAVVRIGNSVISMIFVVGEFDCYCDFSTIFTPVPGFRKRVTRQIDDYRLDSLRTIRFNLPGGGTHEPHIPSFQVTSLPHPSLRLPRSATKVSIIFTALVVSANVGSNVSQASLMTIACSVV
jgi:hypothetical protein